MAYFRKIGNVWRAEIRRRGFSDISQSGFKTKGGAAAWAAIQEAAILAGKHRDIPDVPFSALLKRYGEEVSPKKKGVREERVRIGLFLRDSVASVPLRALDASHVSAWRDRRLQAVSGASVRREWNLLSNACNIAVREWRWLKENPCHGIKRPKGGKPRERLPTAREMDAISKAATTDARRLALAAFEFACETGMRAGELISLGSVSGVVARLHDTKNGSARDVPLSGRALEIWERFGPFGIKPATLVVQWQNLCADAKVKNLHFHDSRHVAATALSRKLNTLQLAKMLGIKDPRILLVYYNETAEDIAKLL